ncbi:MAG TPA: hypothetical protein DEB06_06235 [Phycisphaerales bacterium]|nr:hypothetical protein [Phycisphaerales bacterium]
MGEPLQSTDPGDSASLGSVGAALDRELKGTLPCVVCGYELQGLSIRGVCPECGTAVRATILFHVDPRAEEFKPIATPWVTAWALVLWSSAALVATLACWWPRVADVIGMFTQRPPTSGAGSFCIGGTIASGLAALGLIRVVRGGMLRQRLAAGVAAAAYLPLGWALWRIHGTIDTHRPAPYFTSEFNIERTILRLLVAASVVTIILGIRPNARDLVRRSRAMRTGRVDRQHLVLMAATLALASVGDFLRYYSHTAGPQGTDAWEVAGILLIIVGSCFFTLGLVGATRDCWRLHRVIRLPNPSLRQVLGRK